MGMITHLEPDILECEIKWALGSITTNKASGGDGIPIELFQILKDDTVKVLHSICQQIWKTQQWSQDMEAWYSVVYGVSKRNDWATGLKWTELNLYFSRRMCLNTLLASVQEFIREKKAVCCQWKISAFARIPLNFKLNTPPVSWSFSSHFGSFL